MSIYEEEIQSVINDYRIRRNYNERFLKGKCGENLEFTFLTEEGIINIEGSGKMYDYTESEKPPWLKINQRIDQIYLDNRITHIGDFSFSKIVNRNDINRKYKRGKVNMEFHANLESIGKCAFAMCNFTDITFNSSRLKIGTNAFVGCKDLRGISVPNPLDITIENGAFENCIKLTCLSIPNASTLKSSENAFKNTYKSFSISQLTPFLKENFSLKGTAIDSKGGWELKDTSFNYFEQLETFTSCMVHNSVVYRFETHGGVLNINGSKVVRRGNVVKRTTMNEKINIHDKWKVRKLVIHDNIQKIEDEGLSGLYLDDIEIHQNVVEIGEFAFGKCGSVDTVTFHEIIELNQCAFLRNAKPRRIIVYLHNAYIPISFLEILKSIIRNSVVYLRGLDGTMLREVKKKLFKYFHIVFETSKGCYSGYTKDDLEWDFDRATGELKIRGASQDRKGRCANFIDSYINKDHVKKITIEDNISKILDGAFSNYMNLKEVSIGKHLVSIENSAFAGCINLTTFLPNKNRLRVREKAFLNCKKLSNFVMLSGLEYGEVFINCMSLVLSFEENATQNCIVSRQYDCKILDLGMASNYNYNIGSRILEMFKVNPLNRVYETDLDGVLFNKGKTCLIKCPKGYRKTEYIIPNSVKEIRECAFADCFNLVSIIIPDSVVIIRSEVFGGCINLVSIKIPENIRILGHHLFVACFNLKEIYFHGEMCEYVDDMELYRSDITIYYNPFCSSWTKVAEDNKYRKHHTISSWIVDDDKNKILWEIDTRTNLLTIDGKADENNLLQILSIKNPSWLKYSKYITEIAIVKDSINGIGNYAFANLENLIRVSIPDCVKSIGEFAFSSCTNLVECTLPKYITVISNGLFINCSKLERIEMSNKVISIGNSAFADCISLESLAISDQIIDIRNTAFAGCKQLKSINIPLNVAYISSDAFALCSKKLEITVEPGNIHFSEDTRNGLFNKDKTEQIL